MDPHNVSAIPQEDEQSQPMMSDDFKLDDDDEIVVNPLAEDAKSELVQGLERLDYKDNDTDIQAFEAFSAQLSQSQPDSQAISNEIMSPVNKNDSLEIQEQAQLGDIFDSIDQFDRFHGLQDEPQPDVEAEVIHNPLKT